MDEKKLKFYLENIREAFSAIKESGLYVNCEFKIDLKNKSVFHSLASTNGEDVLIIQKDRFPYNDEFKRKLLEPTLGYFGVSGVISTCKSNRDKLTEEESSKSSLKSITSYNNILHIAGAELSYLAQIESTLKAVQKTLK